MAEETFEIRLKKALEMRKMKPIQLADKLGINRAIISQYINGKYKPNHHRFYEIAEVLGVDEAWLLGLDVPIRANVTDSIDELYMLNKEKLTKDDKNKIKQIIYDRLEDDKNE